ncbi:MAG: serine/threonine-protein phosphatase [Planctomycetales bacterium]|nr:serine/threonine-protein phosphatase [Planctomycetales bacterium]
MAQTTGQWSEYLDLATLTDVGMRRSVNQDSHVVVLASDPESWITRGHVFIVADGMGAHAAGELASKLAVDNIPHTYYKLAEFPAPAALEKSIVEANALIHRRGEADSEFHGMGTTCSALAILPHGAVCAHVGDSRIYRLRGTKLEQLSFDHSLVWEMAAAGKLKDQEVPSFIPKNVITRSLGPNAQVQVDVEGPFPIQPGDRFLLCSDGLTGPVDDKELGAILASLSLDDAVQTLVDLANLRGGPDNITVVALEVKDPQFGGAAQIQPQEAKKVKKGPIHPAAIGVVGVCLLAGCVLAILQQLLVAGICAGVALLAGLLGHFQRFETDTPLLGPQPIGGPFGRGPHRAYDSEPNEELLAKFHDMLSRLNDAAQRENWAIDWEKFQQLRSAAESARNGRDFKTALKNYCEAIRFVLSELRHSGERR